MITSEGDCESFLKVENPFKTLQSQSHPSLSMILQVEMSLFSLQTRMPSISPKMLDNSLLGLFLGS